LALSARETDEPYAVQRANKDFSPIPSASDSLQTRTGKYRTWALLLLLSGATGLLLGGALVERFFSAAVVAWILSTLLLIAGIVIFSIRALRDKR
jgi:hypothetical protein